MIKINKKILLVTFLLSILSFNISYANYISYSAPIMHVEVENINEDIKSIWLCIYDDLN